MKYFRFTRNQILWEISWANLLMFSATVPDFKTGDKDDIDDEDVPEITGAGLGAFLGL